MLNGGVFLSCCALRGSFIRPPVLVELKSKLGRLVGNFARSRNNEGEILTLGLHFGLKC